MSEASIHVQHAASQSDYIIYVQLVSKVLSTSIQNGDHADLSCQKYGLNGEKQQLKRIARQQKQGLIVGQSDKRLYSMQSILKA
jgi:hypothetical protein